MRFIFGGNFAIINLFLQKVQVMHSSKFFSIRFFLNLETLVGCVLSGPTSPLAFSDSVLNVINQNAKQLDNKEHLWRMWSIIVTPLTELINQVWYKSAACFLSFNTLPFFFLCYISTWVYEWKFVFEWKVLHILPVGLVNFLFFKFLFIVFLRYSKKYNLVHFLLWLESQKAHVIDMDFHVYILDSFTYTMGNNMDVLT